MPTDRDTLTQELAALMHAHNKWTTRVERLRRLARNLADDSAAAPPPPAAPAGPELAEQLARALAELEAARTVAADWEQKARGLSQTLYKERSEKARRIRALEQEVMALKYSSTGVG